MCDELLPIFPLIWRNRCIFSQYISGVVLLETENVYTCISVTNFPDYGGFLRFPIFSNGSEQIPSHTRLVDPVHTQTTARPAGANEPWNGEVYNSFGHYHKRSWEEAVQ